MKQNWLIHDNNGTVEGSAGKYLVVLGSGEREFPFAL